MIAVLRPVRRNQLRVNITLGHPGVAVIFEPFDMELAEAAVALPHHPAHIRFNQFNRASIL
jgi:hypothetical protein